MTDLTLSYEVITEGNELVILFTLEREGDVLFERKVRADDEGDVTKLCEEMADTESG